MTYLEVAINYANKAKADKKGKYHCLMIRQAADRFLNDLKRAKKKNNTFFFDEWHCNDVCDFIEKLPHVDGKWDTPNIELHESHVFFLVQLFGFRKKEGVYVEGWGDDETFYPRRYTSALFAVARKNAKSLLASSILNYCLCCEPEEGAQIISAATTFQQASIVFKASKRQIEKTPDLVEAFNLSVWAKEVTCSDTGAVFHAIHAKAGTQDGLNPSHVCLDEIHAHKDSDLLNVLTSAAGARNNPLWLYTTTEGYVNTGAWSEIRIFAKKLLAGIFGNDADHFLVIFYALDEENKTFKVKEDDEFNPATWIKANPLLNVNPYLKAAIEKEAVEAKEMPSKLAEFRIKRLNRPASTSGGWVDLNKWNKCAGKIDLEFLKDYPCYGGLDLASTMDIASFRLVWDVEGHLFTKGWRYCPEDGITQRTARGTVPYGAWVEQGLIIQTEGNIIDYKKIEADIVQACEDFDVRGIGYDKWNSSDIVSRLVEADVPMIEFIQGTRSYHPAMRALEEKYTAKKFSHGGDPVLGWCASNLVSRQDQNENNAPDRKKSADKIDDIVALLMAVGVSNVQDEENNLDGFIECPIIV